VGDFTSLSQWYYVNRKGIDLNIVTILDDIHFSKPLFNQFTNYNITELSPKLCYILTLSQIMKTTFKLAMVLGLGIAITFCTKKSDPSPSSDYVSQFVGTYTTSGTAYNTAVVTEVSANVAQVTFQGTSPSVTLNLTYASSKDSNATYNGISGTYHGELFSIPTTSSAGFSAYGLTTDLSSSVAGIQNAALYTTSFSYLGISYSIPSLSVFAQTNNGVTLPPLYSK
jgi:hypothetical protein